MRPSRLLLIAALCLFGLGSTGQAAEHIKDNLRLFSEPALAAAEKQIDEVWKEHRRMIEIETRTAPKLPANVDPNDKAAVDAYYTRWSHEEMQRNNIDGAYLVVTVKPSKFFLWVSEDMLTQKVVSKAEVDTWKAAFGNHLRKEEYDAALRESVASISAKFSATPAKSGEQRARVPLAIPGNNQPARPVPPAPAADNQGPSILTWVLIALGVFIVFRIIRSFMAAKSNANGYGPGGTPNQYGPGNAGGPGYGGGMGGGGFMTSMLGGLFGGMAGNWMYDRMSGGNQAHGAEPPTSSSANGGYLNDSSSADSEPADYGGGGDWGDSGGGDFGGDAGGGGDW